MTPKSRFVLLPSSMSTGGNAEFYRSTLRRNPRTPNLPFGSSSTASNVGKRLTKPLLMVSHSLLGSDVTYVRADPTTLIRPVFKLIIDISRPTTLKLDAILREILNSKTGCSFVSFPQYTLRHVYLSMLLSVLTRILALTAVKSKANLFNIFSSVSCILLLLLQIPKTACYPRPSTARASLACCSV
jgi:hypothetical protein